MITNITVIAKYHNIAIGAITTFIAFSINSIPISANVAFPKVVAREYNLSIATEKIFIEQFSINVNDLLAMPRYKNQQVLAEYFNKKARDLLISPDNNVSNKDRLELLKRLLFVFRTTKIEIGEYSCYSASPGTMRFLNTPPKQTSTLTVSTPIQEKRTVKLESNETILPKSYCNEVINMGYEWKYLERQLDIQVRELGANLYMQKPIQNSELELDIPNNWNILNDKINHKNNKL